MHASDLSHIRRAHGRQCGLCLEGGVADQLSSTIYHFLLQLICVEPVVLSIPSFIKDSAEFAYGAKLLYISEFTTLICPNRAKIRLGHV